METNRQLSDSDALDLIQDLLKNPEWEQDFMEIIFNYLCLTGRDMTTYTKEELEIE